MLTYFSGGEGSVKYVPVGVIVIFGLLLIYTLLTFISRLSTRLNRTFVFILSASVFGLINGACLVYMSIAPYYYSSSGSSPNYYVLIPLTLFGLALVPMTWMSGFSVFSTLFGKSIQINLSYILTVIQLILSVAAAAIYGAYVSGKLNYHVIYIAMYTAITALRWLYFLLFFALVVRHRHELNRLGKTVLISFGIMNTVRLLVDTILIKVSATGFNAVSVYLFINFFFTDFLSALSMFLLVTFYKNITTKNDMYDN